MERFGRNTVWLTLVIAGLILIVGLLDRGAGTHSAPTGSQAAVPAGDEIVVELAMMRFEPSRIQVPPGTTIRFVNRDPMLHNVVHARPDTLGKGPEKFRSPQLGPGDSWTLTLTVEGVYDILCDIAGHFLAGMVGQIVVTQDTAAREAEPAGTAGQPVARDPRDLPGPIDRDEPTVVRFDLRTVEVEGQLAEGITFTYWTYNGTVPGPLLRVRQGDTVELYLTNDASSTQPHSIDLHAVTGPGGGAAVTQVAPGETKAFRFKALHPGVYVYHCATPHIPTHIAMGMYGLIVVEPPEGLVPVDHEFYVMQGEVYADLRPGSQGHAAHDPAAMWDERPNFVVFNGQFQALTGDRAMRVNVGDTVRIFFGVGGPNLPSSLHLIGEVFDRLHPEGAAEPATHVQTTLVPAGGATWVEFTVDVPGTYTLVDHSLSRAVDKGALATIEAVGPGAPDIFAALDD
ncbi:MAG: nitrite reductase, copper-containing [Firmicutes bacterium]|nr:nitrite reductase, copper-containing [Bacillota bacterium]